MKEENLLLEFCPLLAVPCVKIVALRAAIDIDSLAAIGFMRKHV